MPRLCSPTFGGFPNRKTAKSPQTKTPPAARPFARNDAAADTLSRRAANKHKPNSRLRRAPLRPFSMVLDCPQSVESDAPTARGYLSDY